MTLYFVIVKENLPWLISFLVITAGTLTCFVLESLKIIGTKTLTTVALAAFIPWLVSMVVFATDATSRNRDGKKLTIEDDD